MIYKTRFYRSFFFLLALKPLCAFPILFEVNPLLMINQGIGVYAEQEAFSPTTSLGIGVESFWQTPYARNDVRAKRRKWIVAPQFRNYFFTGTQAGLFLGAKFAVGWESAEICDSDTCMQKSKTFIAPIAQAGYRFFGIKGLTFSVYLGAGIRTSIHKINDDDIAASKQSSQDWQNAKDTLNKRQSHFQPDYGFTVGYDF